MSTTMKAPFQFNSNLASRRRIVARPMIIYSRSERKSVPFRKRMRLDEAETRLRDNEARRHFEGTTGRINTDVCSWEATVSRPTVRYDTMSEDSLTGELTFCSWKRRRRRRRSRTHGKVFSREFSESTGLWLGLPRIVSPRRRTQVDFVSNVNLSNIRSCRSCGLNRHVEEKTSLPPSVSQSANLVRL